MSAAPDLRTAKIALVVAVGWFAWSQVEAHNRARRRAAFTEQAERRAVALKAASVMQKNAAATLEAVKKSTPSAIEQQAADQEAQKARLEAVKLAYYAQQSLRDAAFSRQAALGVPFEA